MIIRKDGKKCTVMTSMPNAHSLIQIVKDSLEYTVCVYEEIIRSTAIYNLYLDKSTKPQILSWMAKIGFPLLVR